MKDSHYFLAVSLAIALNTSCTQDDEPTFVPAQSTLTGLWGVFAVEGAVYTADLWNDALQNGGLSVTFLFNEDGTGNWTYGYSYDFYFYDLGYYTEWTLEGDKLQITWGEQGEKVWNFEIQSLSERYLDLLSEGPFDDGPEAGLTLKLEKY